MRQVDVKHIQSVEQHVAERADREIRAQRPGAAGDEADAMIIGVRACHAAGVL